MITKLNEICDFLSGNAWKASSFQDSGVPIIRINNMNFNDNDFVYWQDIYDKKYLINKGDLLLSLSGTIKTFKWNGPEALLNQRIVKITAKESLNVNIDWIYYQLHYAIEVIANKGKNAVIRNVSVNDLKAFEVDLPDIQTQNKIVAILDKASALIKKREESIAMLDELLRATFLDMFGDPAVNPKELELVSVESIMNKIDAGWSPVCEEKPRSNDDEWAVLKQGAVSRRFFNPLENKLLPIGIDIKKEITAQKGDLLFSRKNSKEYVGSTAYVFEDYEKLLLPDTIFNLRYIHERVSGIYLFYLFNDKNYQNVVQNLRTGAAGSMPNISQQKLMEHSIPLPKITEQRTFEKIVLDVYKKKKKLLESKDEIENLSNSIIQKVFNGQLNFNVDFELDALINEIDIQNKENDLSKISGDIAYLQRLIDKLNNQEFKEKEMYDKAKHGVFQLMAVKEEKRKVIQEYDENSKRLKLALK